MVTVTTLTMIDVSTFVFNTENLIKLAQCFPKETLGLYEIWSLAFNSVSCQKIYQPIIGIAINVLYQTLVKQGKENLTTDLINDEIWFMTQIIIDLDDDYTLLGTVLDLLEVFNTAEDLYCYLDNLADEYSKPVSLLKGLKDNGFELDDCRHGDLPLVNFYTDGIHQLWETYLETIGDDLNPTVQDLLDFISHSTDNMEEFLGHQGWQLPSEIVVGNETYYYVEN